MTWVILGTISALITLVGVLEGGPSVIHDWTSADNDKAEADRLQAQEEVIEAKNRRNKAVWRGVIITASIVSSVVTIYLLLKPGKIKRTFKKRK